MATHEAKIQFKTPTVLSPEYVANNLQIEINGETFTLIEFVKDYMRQEEYLTLIENVLTDVRNELEKRFDIDEEYSIDEVAALIASGHISQRDEWTPEND